MEENGKGTSKFDPSQGMKVKFNSFLTSKVNDQTSSGVGCLTPEERDNTY